MGQSANSPSPLRVFVSRASLIPLRWWAKFRLRMTFREFVFTLRTRRSFKVLGWNGPRTDLKEWGHFSCVYFKNTVCIQLSMVIIKSTERSRTESQTREGKCSHGGRCALHWQTGSCLRSLWVIWRCCAKHWTADKLRNQRKECCFISSCFVLIPKT